MKALKFKQNIMKFGTLLIATLISGLFSVSCNNSGEGGDPYKKNVSGKAGEVIVVIAKENWEGKSGEALKEVLACDYPMLPQREPAFNLINIPDNAFNDIFRSHRNIVMVTLNASSEKREVVINRDLWAKPQIVVRVQAPSDSAAANLINSKSELIFNAIDQIEKDRLIRNAKRYEQRDIRPIVAEMFGGSPYFPNGYSIRKQNENFIWVGYETSYTIQGVLIYKLPYNGVEFPSKEEILEKQSAVLKQNVPGMFEGTYMIISKAPEVVPTMKTYKYKNDNFVEIRGLWEVEGDFMGGPFVEHIRYAKEEGKLLVIQAFVYAPRYKKRNYLRQVESILYSFEWQENFSNQ